MTKIFTSLVGRRCRAALEFRAERQLCPTTMVKIYVLHPFSMQWINKAGGGRESSRYFLLCSRPFRATLRLA
jgi:hypothetical protein